MQDKSLYNMNTAGLESAISTNKVLKNTYMLLGITLLFSAITAGISMAMGLGHGAALVSQHALGATNSRDAPHAGRSVARR